MHGGRHPADDFNLFSPLSVSLSAFPAMPVSVAQALSLSLYRQSLGVRRGGAAVLMEKPPGGRRVKQGGFVEYCFSLLLSISSSFQVSRDAYPPPAPDRV
jgi:hypothetical protein